MATLRIEIESTIGEGVHTSLRKFCESDASKDAWRAIHRMPEKEWEIVCRIVTDEIMKLLPKTMLERQLEQDAEADKPFWAGGSE